MEYDRHASFDEGGEFMRDMVNEIYESRVEVETTKRFWVDGDAEKTAGRKFAHQYRDVIGKAQHSLEELTQVMHDCMS